MKLVFEGSFGEGLASELRSSGWLHTVAPLRSLRSGGGGELVVALSAPDLGLLERVVAGHRGPVGVLYPLEQYIVSGPWFEAGSPCVPCLRARMLANPPAEVTSVLLRALLEWSEEESGVPHGFGYRGAAGPLVSAAGELLLAVRPGTTSSAGTFHLLGLRGEIVSSRLIARHGCACRERNGQTLAGPARFMRLRPELLAALHGERGER